MEDTATPKLNERKESELIREHIQLVFLHSDELLSDRSAEDCGAANPSPRSSQNLHKNFVDRVRDIIRQFLIYFRLLFLILEYPLSLTLPETIGSLKMHRLYEFISIITTSCGLSLILFFTVSRRLEIILFFNCYGLFTGINVILPWFVMRDRCRRSLFKLFSFRMQSVHNATSEWLITLLGIGVGLCAIGFYQIIMAEQSFFVSVANMFSLSLLFHNAITTFVEFSILTDLEAIEKMEPNRLWLVIMRSFLRKHLSKFMKSFQWTCSIREDNLLSSHSLSHQKEDHKLIKDVLSTESTKPTQIVIRDSLNSDPPDTSAVSMLNEQRSEQNNRVVPSDHTSTRRKKKVCKIEAGEGKSPEFQLKSCSPPVRAMIQDTRFRNRSFEYDEYISNSSSWADSPAELPIEAVRQLSFTKERSRCSDSHPI